MGKHTVLLIPKGLENLVLVLLQIVDDIVNLVEIADSFKQVDKEETEVLSHFSIIAL